MQIIDRGEYCSHVVTILNILGNYADQTIPITSQNVRPFARQSDHQNHKCHDSDSSIEFSCVLHPCLPELASHQSILGSFDPRTISFGRKIAHLSVKHFGGLQSKGLFPGFISTILKVW